MSSYIALISEHASPLGALGGVDSGGQNVYVAQVARELVELGFRVDVFTRRDSPELPEIHTWQDNLRVVHVPAGPPTSIRKEELLRYMDQFTDYMLVFCRRRRPFDLIHANFWMSALVGADLKQALGIPLVVTFHALGKVRKLHQGQADTFPDERLAIEERVVREADCIVAECPQDKLDQLTLYAADPRKIAVVPCGCDVSEVWPLDRDACRSRLGLPRDQPIILQLGRMVPRKGVDNVVQALARAKHRHRQPAKLIVVGGESDVPDASLTPEIGRLQQLAAEEGVADDVIFFGRKSRHDLKYFYGAADVFVSTPWYEPFGITPLEAMACARPVIGSRVGGLKFSVVHRKTGYLVPPRDPDALADRLARLLGNPGLCERMGNAGLRRVKRMFTWSKVVRSLVRVYEKVLSQSPLPQAPLESTPQPASTHDLATSNHRSALAPAIFLDKDGTLINDVPHNVDCERITLSPGALAALARWHSANYRLIVVSNQSGVAHGYFGERDVARVASHLESLLRRYGIPLTGFYYCPHHPQASDARYHRRCTCRKPAAGMLEQAAAELNIELSDSWMIGDILNDVEAGHRAGCRSILLVNGNETEWLGGPLRIPDYQASCLMDACRFVLAAGQVRPLPLPAPLNIGQEVLQ
jgi:histidinol-phosphate phosphatase family protein